MANADSSEMEILPNAITSAVIRLFSIICHAGALELPAPCSSTST